MSAAALAGWLVAAAACGALARMHRHEGARRERIARACHELRGPLHAAGLALHGAAHLPRVRAAEHELRRAGLALADLEAARTARAARAPGRPVTRPATEEVAVDLGALVARHAAAWRAVASGRGCRLRVRLPVGPALVHGDPLRLAQAAANLVANAAEHGAGEIALRVHGAGEVVALEVTDEGPGLPAPVAAIAARPRSGRGSRGRGLAIASEIAAAHGGRLAAAPAPRGARLVLELPRAPAPQAAPQGASA